jgi:hypothetical protein
LQECIFLVRLLSFFSQSSKCFLQVLTFCPQVATF